MITLTTNIVYKKSAQYRIYICSSPLKSNIIYGGSLGKDEIKVGDRVNVKDLVANDGTNKTRSCLGTVRFVGSVDFVKGDNK
jgi:hypothetical protein